MSSTQGVFGHTASGNHAWGLGMSIVAFESLAIATIAPRSAESLGGVGLYGWVFISFLLMSLLGVILAGQHIDRHGPGPALAAGLAAFGAGFAPTMPALLAGRALQGLGAGAINTALYASVNLAYRDALRPRLMSLLSTAWVLPTLIGPAPAGSIADVSTWRVVFPGIVPFLAVLVAPTFRELRQDEKKEPETTDASNPLRASQATVGTGFLVRLSATSPTVALVLAVLDALVAIPALLPSAAPRHTYGPFGFGGGHRLESAFRRRLRRGAGLFIGAYYECAGVFGLCGGSSYRLRLCQSDARHLAAKTPGQATWGSRAAAACAHRDAYVSARNRGAAAGAGVSAAFAYHHNSWPGRRKVRRGCRARHRVGAHIRTRSERREAAVSSVLQLADQFAPALSTGVAGALFTVATRSAWSEAGGVGLAVALSLVLVPLSAAAAHRIGTAR